ncbi:HAD family hydrolase [Shewanella surugensis]|uniref:phosphoglycolate phosphatase n=1 Tax=Shewanella surugensis TaxID=212020 RepID=A0ABT0LHP6_9GAMM|nr:HAD hydrolase-like protein [Shewanella surugensis]MCL1127228.1 HAD family hydrolase [Shewanella surugensis]
MNPKLMIFDFDGCLVDSRNRIIELTYQTLAYFEHSASKEQIEESIGQATNVRFKEYGLACNDIDKGIEKFGQLHCDDDYCDVQTISGVTEWLNAYSHIEMWVISGSPYLPVNKAINRLGLNKFFSRVITREQYSGLTKKDFLSGIVSPKNHPMLFFGDEKQDLDAGHLLGATRILVRGPVNETLEVHADLTINDFNDHRICFEK